MTASPTDSPDFVRLNGETVRVTSLRQETDGTRHLVVILRGSRDTEQLLGILETSPITLGIDSQLDETVIVGEIDRRVFGEGQSAITRLDISLHPAVSLPAAPAPPPTVEERVAILESTVADLLARIDHLQRHRQ